MDGAKQHDDDVFEFLTDAITGDRVRGDGDIVGGIHRCVFSCGVCSVAVFGGDVGVDCDADGIDGVWVRGDERGRRN